MLAMNRQWVRKSRLSTQSYLAETTPAVSTTNNTSAVSLPGLTPGSVTVGDQIAIMPYVLDNNTVVLKFGLSFSDLLKLDIVGSGEGVSRQQVQVPSTALLSDQFTVALRPGEVFAITGLSRDTSSVDKATLGEALSVWAGGSQRSSSNREHFLVFLRVVIL
jgi:Flp pilus assembly secretin CpaC